MRGVWCASSRLVNPSLEELKSKATASELTLILAVETALKASVIKSFKEHLVKKAASIQRREGYGSQPGFTIDSRDVVDAIDTFTL